MVGGKFYVTELEIHEKQRTGTVKYEDGHNAYEAAFTYTTDPESGIKITSFMISQ